MIRSIRFEPPYRDPLDDDINEDCPECGVCHYPWCKPEPIGLPEEFEVEITEPEDENARD